MIICECDKVNIQVEEFWVSVLFAAISDHRVLHTSESLADDNGNVH